MNFQNISSGKEPGLSKNKVLFKAIIKSQVKNILKKRRIQLSWWDILNGNIIILSLNIMRSMLFELVTSKL